MNNQSTSPSVSEQPDDAENKPAVDNTAEANVAESYAEPLPVSVAAENNAAAKAARKSPAEVYAEEHPFVGKVPVDEVPVDEVPVNGTVVPVAAPGMNAVDRDKQAQEMIAQGRADDEAASQAENDRENDFSESERSANKPAEGKPLHEAEAEGRKLLAEQEANAAKVEKVDPLGKIGDDVSYISDNGHTYPAKVTHIDEETGTVSLAVFYKNSLSFISDISSADQKKREEAKHERGEAIGFGPPRKE